MILSEVLNTIRSREFALHCAALVERDASYNFLSLALKDESVKTFWDWGLTVEPLQPKQKITTNLSYDFDLSIKKSLESFGLTIDKKNTQNADVRIHTDDEGWVGFEIKTTQSPEGGGWTGSTNSLGGGKVNNYILVKYEIDKHMPISKDGSAYGLIKRMHFSAPFCLNANWNGNPTKTNSRTSMKLLKEDIEVYKSSIAVGSVKPARKYVHAIMESLEPHRNSFTGEILRTNVFHK